MKSKRINKEGIGRAISTIVGIVIAALFSFSIYNVVTARGGVDTGGTSGGSGPGSHPQTNCNSPVQHWCYSWIKNGGFWLKVPVTSDNFKVSDLFPGYVNEINGTNRVIGCASGGGEAYIYFTREYTYDNEYQDQIVFRNLAGIANMKQVPAALRDSKWVLDYGESFTAPSGISYGTQLPETIRNYYITLEEAEAAFRKHEDFYHTAAGGNRWWENGKGDNNLGWFCANPETTTTTTTTTTTITTTYDKINCEEHTTMTNYAGETKTRIAVENMSLDGKHASSELWGPSASSVRYSDDYPADSGWTDSTKITYTLAKPGDSVHFLHEICVGDRYVRKARTSVDFVTGAVEDKDRKTNPTFDSHYVEVGANDFNGSDGKPYTNLSFLTSFSNPVTLTPANSTAGYQDAAGNYYSRRVIFNKTLASTAVDNLFDSISGTGNDIVESSDGYGISITSPSKYSRDFDCSTYGYTDFIDGGYQVSDFNGEYCNSAAKTKVNSAVGQVISQYHKFSSAKAYEKYRHDRANNCSCSKTKPNDPSFSNHTNTSIADANSGHNGNLQGSTSCQYNPSTQNCGTYTYTSYYPYFYGQGINGVASQSWQPYCVSSAWHYPYHHQDPTIIAWCDTWKDDHSNGKDGYWDSYELGTSNFPTSYKYDVTVSAGSRVAKVADVFVPYNFETSISASIGADNVVYQGGITTSVLTWQILPRANEYITKNASEKYATSTPTVGSEVRMVEFMLPPNKEINIAGTKTSSKDPCSYYDGAVDCHTVNNVVTGNLNPNGINGSPLKTEILAATIPDDKEYVGYKYCVAAGIFPSDSHDYKNTLKTQYSYGNTASASAKDGSAMDAGSYWNISNASCRTIAKKPSFQVWNGAVYTEGSIDTSITKKRVNIEYGTTGWEEAETIFGSWADYAVIAGNTVKGFGSGASLGYNKGYHYLKLANSGLEATSFKQNSSPLTISNDNKDELGKSQINASTSVASVIEKMKARYRDKAASLSASLGTGSSKKLYTTSSALQYVYTNSDLKISEIGKGAVSGASAYNTAEINSSMLVKRFLTDAAISSGNEVDNTLIIYSTGTVTIDKNICYLGASELNAVCEQSYNATQLSNYSNSKTKTPAALPQILIFADKINITEDVNRVDAWLFSESDINTCSNFNLNSSDATVGYKPNGSLQLDMITTIKHRSKCYRTLMVNGPVFAQNIILNRTAGAHHGYGTDTTNVLNRTVGDNAKSADRNNGSAAPAEIFNLRSDAYIWSRTQAGGNSEAIVTYIRELAPRY